MMTSAYGRLQFIPINHFQYFWGVYQLKLLILFHPFLNYQFCEEPHWREWKLFKAFAMVLSFKYVCKYECKHVCKRECKHAG